MPPKKGRDQLFNKERPNPPPEVEEELLEKFSNFCDENDSQDLLASQLMMFFKQELKIPDRLLVNVVVSDYVIEGTEVVGFEEYLSKSGLLVVMRDNVRKIDEAWKLFIRHCKKKDKKPGDVSKDGVYSERIYLDDLISLQQILNDNTPRGLLIDMIEVATQGARPYVNYADFAMVMGKMGELNF
ncbi:unnamed protein product [Kuraishia capsulata CBS 1993]|uniref:EF-hand domain-containing protein n=1 Tax=Kuraishia capsulata CBS 1993 TaxID=1382522 RepID=W6MQM1_9ASCO|nr:uncharacterized protein KUCA_T00005015001 [Kuraishia capsulata CBS 1993]CDK29029.1 unnamed protein product [Kuraishia capsulata CBS 1993]